MSTSSKAQSSRTGLAVGGFVLLHVLCCGLPLLIAAGALGAAGSFLGNPWVILAAVALAGAGLLMALRRRRPGVSGEMEDCCASAAASGEDRNADRTSQPTGSR
ncbi:hypothetical protein GCM10009700_29360 [Brevibacterium sanguinis]|uniref:hypothetical protein n=1 Tax=Brevibacterium sanguinis TaxID=232444 RepID=UPI0031CEBCD0